MIQKFDNFKIDESIGSLIISPSKLYALTYREFDGLMKKIMDIYNIDENAALINMELLCKFNRFKKNKK